MARKVSAFLGISCRAAGWGAEGSGTDTTPALAHRLPDRKGRQTWRRPSQCKY